MFSFAFPLLSRLNLSRRVFQHLFLFPTVHLQPHEISPFTTNLLEHVLFHHEAVEPTMKIVLGELSGLGLHTRILHLSSTTSNKLPSCRAVRHVWSQRLRRPWGLDAPSYCNVCKSVKTFVGYKLPDSGGKVVQFKCCGPADKQGPECIKQITVVLTSAETRLLHGPKDACGLWQQHAFEWDADLLDRF